MKVKRKPLINETTDAWILISPLMILIFAFIAFPTISNFYYGFMKWDGISDPKFIGFDNYVRMIGDDRFHSALRNMGLLILYIPLGVMVPLVLANILRGGIKGWTAFRAIYYLPNVLGPVLIGILYAIIFSQIGPLTAILVRLGVPGAESFFLFRQSVTAMNALAFIFVIWMRIGFGIIYFLAAMSAIDKSLYEAADMDGINAVQKFFYVTIPNMTFAIQFFTVLCFIEVSARMYGIIHTLTRGGPGAATNTMEYAIYILSFTALQAGYAAAWAVVLFCFCSAIALVQIHLIKKGKIL